MDEKLVRAGKFLEDISSDPGKLQCLNQFIKCQEVIKWLRNVTSGKQGHFIAKCNFDLIILVGGFNVFCLLDVNDLQNFVNVALATAAGGEDDLAHDKLSDLRTVGNGFGALIYKLPNHAGYSELAQQCRSLWIALQNNHNLPDKLVSLITPIRFIACRNAASVSEDNSL